MTADYGARDTAGPARPAAPEPSFRFDVDAVREILPHLMDSLSDAVLVVDRRQRVVAANRRYVEVFGAVRVEAAQSVCSDAFHCPEEPEDGPPGCVACDVIRERRPMRRLHSLPDDKGQQRRWEATFSPILHPGGEVTHVVEVWRDITERTALESQLSHNERLASLGILAAGVGHEINNPLASMMAGLESLGRWILRREFTPEGVAEAEEILNTLDREVTRCRETTDKLMLLAQPYSTAPSWVDVNKGVRDTVSLLRYEARRHNVKVVEELDPDLPPIWAKDTGIRSILMNLMMNAVQAMTDGGKLNVTTARAGARVIVAVEDTGPGIPPQIADRIWDPFFTTKPVGKGTGLGLSITNRVVTRHGGTIRLEHPERGGARFVVELPVAGSGGANV